MDLHLGRHVKLQSIGKHKTLTNPFSIPDSTRFYLWASQRVHPKQCEIIAKYVWHREKSQ